MIADYRRCERCACVVTNENLGSFGGKGSLSGPLRCTKCADGADEEELRDYRRKQFEVAQERVRQATRAEVEAILAEFDHLQSLLALEGIALKCLRRNPAGPEAQRALLLLSREFVRDVTVLLYGFSRRHWR